jgi:hypothetical protein
MTIVYRFRDAQGRALKLNSEQRVHVADCVDCALFASMRRGTYEGCAEALPGIFVEWYFK